MDSQENYFYKMKYIVTDLDILSSTEDNNFNELLEYSIFTAMVPQFNVMYAKYAEIHTKTIPSVRLVFTHNNINNLEIGKNVILDGESYRLVEEIPPFKYKPLTVGEELILCVQIKNFQVYQGKPYTVFHFAAFDSDDNLVASEEHLYIIESLTKTDGTPIEGTDNIIKVLEGLLNKYRSEGSHLE